MGNYLLYIFYRLYVWSERSGKDGAILGVVFAITAIAWFNFVAIFLIIHAIFHFRINLFDILGRSTREIACRQFPIPIIMYVLLIIGKIREKAFSEERIAKYRELSYTARSITVYIVGSIAFFVFAVWLDL